MFKKDLQQKINSIFGVRSTYDAPDYAAPQQDIIFIEIESCTPRITSTKETAKVSGSLTVFSQANRLPFGYFAKRVEQASYSDTRKLFFSPEQDIPNSPARLQNLHERRVPFFFLYDSQFDPDKGTLTQLDTTITLGV